MGTTITTKYFPLVQLHFPLIDDSDNRNIFEFFRGDFKVILFKKGESRLFSLLNGADHIFHLKGAGGAMEKSANARR